MCEVKDLVTEKGKKPSYKKRKRYHTYSQNINTDVCAPEHTNPPDEKYLKKFTQMMCQLKTAKHVILPLFKKLYHTPEADTDVNNEPAESNDNKLRLEIRILNCERFQEMIPTFQLKKF